MGPVMHLGIPMRRLKLPAIVLGEKLGDSKNPEISRYGYQREFRDLRIANYGQKIRVSTDLKNGVFQWANKLRDGMKEYHFEICMLVKIIKTLPRIIVFISIMR